MSTTLLDRAISNLPEYTEKYLFVARKPGRIGFVLFRPLAKRRVGIFATDNDKMGVFVRKLCRQFPSVVKEVVREKELSLGWQELRKKAKDMGMKNWYKSSRMEIEKYVSENKS